MANKPKKPKKPKKSSIVRRCRPRPPGEKATLTLFIGTWERAQNWIRIEPIEQDSFVCVINRCRNRLKELGAEAELKAIEKKRKAETEARIKSAHKKSGYNDWQKKMPGSAYRPK